MANKKRSIEDLKNAAEWGFNPVGKLVSTVSKKIAKSGPVQDVKKGIKKGVGKALCSKKGWEWNGSRCIKPPHIHLEEQGK